MCQNMERLKEQKKNIQMQFMHQKKRADQAEQAHMEVEKALKHVMEHQHQQQAEREGSCLFLAP